MGAPRIPIAQRFWEKVERTSDDDDACWPWKRTAQTGRYGAIKEDGKMKGAHVVAYELQKGPVPPGMQVCHSCDNPPCCRGSHLFAGTPKRNSEDMAQKGRSLSGDNHPRRKHPERYAMGEKLNRSHLSDDDVAEIVRRFAQGENAKALAAEYGTTFTSVYRYAKGERRGAGSEQAQELIEQRKRGPAPWRFGYR